VERVTRKLGRIAALVVVGAALAGCSKKENYADTTAAGMDTTSAMSTTASSTMPAMPDTTTATSTTKTSTKTSTAKKAPKKGTY
jgi:hypothetical protein